MADPINGILLTWIIS